MAAELPPDETTPHELEGGIALALGAEQSGDWKPVVDWLARHPECAAALIRFVGDSGRIARAIAPGPAGSGSVLGDFELCEELGRGAMGVVYRARDRRIGREVAVKVLNPGGVLSAVERTRFRLEAEAMAGLNHQNVLPVFAYGEADGTPYIAMPLVRGGSLAERLKTLGPDRRYSAHAAADLVSELARGVHHAHQRGLIHRDLKPANVLLDQHGSPRVADFGLARRLGATASLGVAGTFAYMAPEQAQGGKPLTTAIDIHAMGVVLFELLTGRVPYGGDVASIVRKLTDPHERAPAVSSLRPDVPADLEAICRKCLERDPIDRYGSAIELAADLANFRAGKPITARARGLYETAMQIITRPPEVQDFVTVPGVAFAALHHPVVHIVIMALVLAGLPGWAFGVMMYHLASWLGQLLWFNARRLDRLNAAEQKALLFNLGTWLAVAALLPLHVTRFGTDVMPLYPVLNVATGLGFFLVAVLFAARHSVIGLLILAQNLALPFLPTWTWPLLHAVTGLVPFTLFGLHLRQVRRESRRAAPGPTPHSPSTT
jgi:serine/threonine-protein kinase